MKKLILSAAIALSALAFTSCLSSNGESKNEATINYGGSLCFNRVTNIETGEIFNTPDPQYSFLLDYTNQLVTPSMTNLKLTEDASGLSFKLPSLKVNLNSQDYSYTVNGTDLIPEGSSQQYVFTTFSFKAIDRAIRTNSGTYIYSPVYDISYTVNGRYSVTVYPTRYDLLGTTTSNADGKDSYTSTKPIYTVTLDTDKNTANLTLTDAVFASNHTTMKFGVKDLPYEIMTDGSIQIKTPADEKTQIIDTAGEVKNAYLSGITIRINVPSSRGSYISFHANIPGMQGSASDDEYDVRANLSYYIPTSEN